MTNKIGLFAILLSLVVISSCKKEETVIPNEEELITTVNFTLVPVGGGTTVTMTYKDLDGDGGNAPVITGGTLAANTTYNATIELLNEQETPAEDITDEVRDEATDHLFFYWNTLSSVKHAYNDQDTDGNPIGIKTTVTTISATSTGSITVLLRHEPNKTASFVTIGNVGNAGGETDIELSFPVDVQ